MDERLIRYFNIMSQIINKILCGSDITYREINEVLSYSMCKYSVNFIKNFADVKLEGGLQKGQLFLPSLNSDFFDKVNSIMEMNDSIYYALLLYYMDRWIYSCYESSKNFEDDIECCEALNDNVAETGIIVLPKVRCKWEKGKRGNSWEQTMYYFYFIDCSKLNGMRLKNYIVDSNVIFELNQESLKIAISPLTREKMVDFSIPYTRNNERTGASQNLFRVEKILDENEMEKLIFRNIVEAGKNGANILVFPEMLGTERILTDILYQLKKRDVCVPPLVVFPSIWKKSENNCDNTNRSCLIYDGDEILFEQYKRCCFKYSKGNIDVYEDISQEEKYNEVHMLHIDNIGRICIIICYDYLDSQNRAIIMENLFPTLVCSPSFSTGSYDFNILSEKYFDNSCNWVWCNTCSAINETDNKMNFEIIGVITTLSKCNDQISLNSFKKIFEGASKCDKKDCFECLFYADIPLFDYRQRKEQEI